MKVYLSYLHLSSYLDEELEEITFYQSQPKDWIFDS